MARSTAAESTTEPHARCASRAPRRRQRVPESSRRSPRAHSTLAPAAVPPHPPPRRAARARETSPRQMEGLPRPLPLDARTTNRLGPTSRSARCSRRRAVQRVPFQGGTALPIDSHPKAGPGCTSSRPGRRLRAATSRGGRVQKNTRAGRPQTLGYAPGLARRPKAEPPQTPGGVPREGKRGAASLQATARIGHLPPWIPWNTVAQRVQRRRARPCARA